MRHLALVTLGVVLLAAAAARAHVDPATCSSTGVSLTVGLLRGDGKTGLSGAASECERVVYRVTLRKADPAACAVSSGTLTLTTPDGVVHTVSERVPCVGGTSGERDPADTDRIVCVPSTTAFEGPPVPYAVRPGDAVDGILTAVARYDGGVAHDNTPNTPGVSALAMRRIRPTLCDDADPCTEDLCDPRRAAAAACSNPPRCEDGDPTTTDACQAGRCVFTPIATSTRTFCGH